MADISQNLPLPGIQVINQGIFTAEWYRVLLTLWLRTGGAPGHDAQTLLDLATLGAVGTGDSGTSSAASSFGFGDFVSLGQPAPDAIAAALVALGGDLRSGSSPVITITLGASPATYQAPVDGNLLIVAGTVTKIELTRDGTFFDTGLTAGFVPMSRGDRSKVTYAVAPTGQFFIPR